MTYAGETQYKIDRQVSLGLTMLVASVFLLSSIRYNGTATILRNYSVGKTEESADRTGRLIRFFELFRSVKLYLKNVVWLDSFNG